MEQAKRRTTLVRIAAIKALLVFKDQLAIKPLIAALKDEDPDLRSNAAQALGELKNSAAIGPLDAVSSDKNINVKSAAQSALGEIGNPSHLESLHSILSGVDPAGRTKAAWELRSGKGSSLTNGDSPPIPHVCHERRNSVWLPRTSRSPKEVSPDNGQSTNNPPAD